MIDYDSLWLTVGKAMDAMRGHSEIAPEGRDLFKRFIEGLTDGSYLDWEASAADEADQFLSQARAVAQVIEKIKAAISATDWEGIESTLKTIKPVDLRKEALWKTVHCAYSGAGDVMYDNDTEDSNDQLADALRSTLNDAEPLLAEDGGMESAARQVETELDLWAQGLSEAMRAAQEYGAGPKANNDRNTPN